MENNLSQKSPNRVIATLLLLALLLCAFLGYRMSKISKELVDLKTLAVQLAIDKAEMKRNSQVTPEPAVYGLTAADEVSTQCAALMNTDYAWDEATQTCTDITNSPEALQELCINNNGVYTSGEPATCIFQ